MSHYPTARRDFLRKLMVGTTAALTLPALASGESFPPVEAPTDAGDERYWESIKRQFAVPNNFLNSAVAFRSSNH